MIHYLPTGLSCCLAVSSLLSCTDKKPNGDSQPRPNILLIMADDLGWSDVGFTGNPIVQTPNLDSLVRQGIEFNHFYAGAPLSSPTRASVLTGRNPFRTGVYSANVGILRPEEITLPEILHDNGYSTGHFGKWHLGTLTYSEVDANRGRPGNTALYNPPALHGYDCCFVTESKVPTYDPMIQPENNDGKFWDFIKDKSSARPYGTSYWDIDGNKVTDNLEGDDSRCIMDRVLPFIESSVDKGNPFLGVIWFHAPHLPCVADPEYVSLYGDLPVDERNYFGCISAMDGQIGRLVKYLKDNGLYDMHSIIGNFYAVTSVTVDKNISFVELPYVTANEFLTLLQRIKDANISLDMISQNVNPNGTLTIGFSLEDKDLPEVRDMIPNGTQYTAISGCVKLNTEGAGMEHKSGVALEVLSILHKLGATVYAITTSETKISSCINAEVLNEAVIELKKYYGI